MTATVYIGLGSNLGDRMTTLTAAVEQMEGSVDVERVSSVYETEPVGGGAQPRYLNAVVGGSTSLEPKALLIELQRIERAFGRQRPYPNAPRTLDLDILFYDEQTINQPGLIIPHPRLHERAFVMIPLAEIVPGLIHPTLGASMAELRDQVGARSEVVRTGFSLY